jgi:hypothetical protein
MFIREGNNRGPAADAATGRQTGHLQDKRNTRTIIRASVTRKMYHTQSKAVSKEKQ